MLVFSGASVSRSSDIGEAELEFSCDITVYTTEFLFTEQLLDFVRDAAMVKIVSLNYVIPVAPCVQG